MERVRRPIAFLTLTALGGFLAGSAVPELFRMGTGDYVSLLGVYSLQKYENTAVDAVRLLPYIVSVRIPVLLFLWMSCYTTAGFLFHLGYVWWLGASSGMLLAVFMLKEGFDGILLFGCCLLPQWILYGTMWRLELGVLLRKMKGSGYLSGGVTSIYRSELGELASIIALCLAGCAAEAFLGIWTLRLYQQLFA